MIRTIKGTLLKKRDESILLEVNGIGYEILVPATVLSRLDSVIDDQGLITLEIFHYFKIQQSSGEPVLVGFTNSVEREFFQEVISVSGIGPQLALRALKRPISEIARAIGNADEKYLSSLPGIGRQKAKLIIAKLQEKIGKFALIKDNALQEAVKLDNDKEEIRDEALAVLVQLQYKKSEAKQMIEKVLERHSDIDSCEKILNYVYKEGYG